MDNLQGIYLCPPPSQLGMHSTVHRCLVPYSLKIKEINGNNSLHHEWLFLSTIERRTSLKKMMSEKRHQSDINPLEITCMVGRKTLESHVL